ncbi:MAG: DUF1080 domain-containing protein [bacterium]|nr:DUF1080 domain-containing protein [bacterium]
MNTHILSKAARIALVLTLVSGAACARGFGKEDFHVEDGKLLRGTAEYTVRAFQFAELLSPSANPDDLALAMARAGEVGANAVCFDLYGFEGKGPKFPKKAVDTFKANLKTIKDARMVSVCRVLGSVPADPKSRKAAVKAAAAALKGELKAIYWIDGPDAEKLARDFLKRAPDCAVAAPGNAPLCVVTDPTAVADDSKKTTLLVGTMPADPNSGVSFILPDKDEVRLALDKAMADPLESQAWSPDNSILTDQERADGWIALFDGKTYNGWLITGDEACWQIKDGCLEWVKKGGGIIRTRDRFDNFQLHIEWKISDGGNSGMFIRAPRAGRQSRLGFEFQMMGDHGKEVGDKMTGACYECVAPAVNAGKPAMEWNVVDITLDGQHYTATLNGQVIHDRNLDDHPKLKLRLKRGFIALQDHSHYVAFRNIKIRPL